MLNIELVAQPLGLVREEHQRLDRIPGGIDHIAHRTGSPDRCGSAGPGDPQERLWLRRGTSSCKNAARQLENPWRIREASCRCRDHRSISRSIFAMFWAGASRQAGRGGAGLGGRPVDLARAGPGQTACGQSARSRAAQGRPRRLADAQPRARRPLPRLPEGGPGGDAAQLPLHAAGDRSRARGERGAASWSPTPSATRTSRRASSRAGCRWASSATAPATAGSPSFEELLQPRSPAANSLAVAAARRSSSSPRAAPASPRE